MTGDLPNLDFVRSTAVISVVVEHILLSLGIVRLGPFPVAYIGVTGVLVFFVLTTLVLMWSLERKPHTLDFYIRRVFRIYPLALAAIVAALILHATIGDFPQESFNFGHLDVRSVVSQLTLVPNITFGGDPLIGVLWSLPYEVEMYVLLPALFFFLRKNFAIWPLLLLWTMDVLLTRRGSPDSHTFGVAIGYFLPGAMAYVGFGRWKPKLSAWLLPIFLGAMWVIFLSHANFHTAWYVCLTLGLALPAFHQMKAKWAIVPSRIIAKYSYGIYLTHPFAIVAGLDLFRGHSLWLRLSVTLVGLAVLPALAYHLLEHPMIRMGSRLARRAEERYEQHELENSYR